MFNIILFDLDGTLTNPKEGITKSVQYAIAHFGIIENDLEKLTSFIGPPLQQEFEKRYGFSSDESKEVLAKYRERFGTVGLYENEVFDGIEDLLSTLKNKGKILAVATSKPEEYSIKILEKFGLIKYFDVVCGSEFNGKRVKKCEVIDEVFKRLKIADKKDSIMVGDREHDVLGAKAAGIKSIGVRFGFAKENELENSGADYICDTVSDLKRLLLE